MEGERICVTGAGGYIASWVVKLLLSRGYKVNGTVRDPSDRKNAHLWSFENAKENLRLFKANLLDYESIFSSVDGCNGVIHVASPVLFEVKQNPEVDLYEPAVTGTRNVLESSLKANAKKVVVLSSISAVAMVKSWPNDKEVDETCWSDLEYCKSLKLWYAVSKTLAETEAWEFAKRTGLNVVTICPSLVIGPMLQSTLNTSALYLLSLLEGTNTRLPYVSNKLSSLTRELIPGFCHPVESLETLFVDVRDTAEAILLVYKKPEAEGRYICSTPATTIQELEKMFKRIHSDYDYSNCYEQAQNPIKFSSLKLMNLGWNHRMLEETLVDAIRNYQEIGVMRRNDC